LGRGISFVGSHFDAQRHTFSARNGPTQTAVEGAANEWDARPAVARALRLTILVFPYAVGFVVAILAGLYFPADELGVNRLLWFMAVAAVSTAIMIPADRLVRQFVPLTGLLMISLGFPDAAPSRFKAAMRSSTTAQIQRRIEETLGSDARGADLDQYLLDLVAVLTSHDRLTRGHSERVRVYATLMGKELRLSKSDQHKLHWAALLHDIGKLDVPSEILNKPALPDDDEWEIIKQHPARADRYMAPLEGWLGDWAKAATDHHLRWDGKGYPQSVGGTDISYAGRLVAIADAYDVMTTARTYKKALSPADARLELSRCAGGQFDPQLVRSFLNIGLSPVRLAGGALASLPALLSAIAGGVATTGGRVLLATSAVTSGVAAVPLMDILPPAETAEITLDASDIAVPSVTPTPLSIPLIAAPARIRTVPGSEASPSPTPAARAATPTRQRDTRTEATALPTKVVPTPIPTAEDDLARGSRSSHASYIVRPVLPRTPLEPASLAPTPTPVLSQPLVPTPSPDPTVAQPTPSSTPTPVPLEVRPTSVATVSPPAAITVQVLPTSTSTVVPTPTTVVATIVPTATIPDPTPTTVVIPSIPTPTTAVPAPTEVPPPTEVPATSVPTATIPDPTPGAVPTPTVVRMAAEGP